MATHKASAKAREADKLRKRAKRAKAKLERDLASGKIDPKSKMGQAASALSRGLGKQIEASYANKTGKREYSKKAESALQRGSSLARDLKTKRANDLQERRNKLFQTSLNEATREGGFSNIKPYEARQFYRATQSIWEGLPQAERNNAITAKLGVTDLQQAYEMVMNDPAVRENLQRAESAGHDLEGYTDENADFYEDRDSENERYDIISSFTPLSFG